jgi:hypothetical protein
LFLSYFQIENNQNSVLIKMLGLYKGSSLYKYKLEKTIKQCTVGIKSIHNNQLSGDFIQNI